MFSCGTEQIKKVEGVHGKDGRDGKDGKDGKDYVPTQPYPTPRQTFEPIPRPAPTMMPPTTQNTDVVIVLTPPYPDCSQTNLCPQNALMACACLNGEWQTVFIIKSEAHKYNIRNQGQCWFNRYELECAPRHKYPTPDQRRC